MTATERRSEIMRILISRRHVTMVHLAGEFGVRRGAIVNDITALTSEYPIETVRGNGGGVRLPDWYRPHSNTLTANQQTALIQLLDTADEFQRKAIFEILTSHGSPGIREKLPPHM